MLFKGIFYLVRFLFCSLPALADGRLRRAKGRRQPPRPRVPDLSSLDYAVAANASHPRGIPVPLKLLNDNGFSCFKRCGLRPPHYPNHIMWMGIFYVVCFVLWIATWCFFRAPSPISAAQEDKKEKHVVFNLNAKYYAEICSGKKTTEFRAASAHWTSRLRF